jgi:UDP:flavonoid glycosyltransferase YjiC (YdhE family)
VFACGAGVRARKRASPRELRRVIAKALEDAELKRGASAVAHALARSDGALTIAESVERLGCLVGA